MNLNFSEEIKMIKNSVKKFVEEVVEPVAMKIEEEDQIPSNIIDMSKELGLFGLSIPEEYGGLGLSMVDKCAIYEELGKTQDRKSTRLNSSHVARSYAVFCLKQKTHTNSDRANA